MQLLELPRPRRQAMIEFILNLMLLPFMICGCWGILILAIPLGIYMYMKEK